MVKLRKCLGITAAIVELLVLESNAAFCTGRLPEDLCVLSPQSM